MRAIAKRLQALEQDAGLSGGFLVIRIVGGFHRGEHGESGDIGWKPTAGETSAEFERRATGEARRAGCKFITFGGLPARKSEVATP